MARQALRAEWSANLTVSEPYRESPIFFPAEGETLFGVLTEPRSSSTGGTVVLVPGGAGTLDGINRNRLWVRFARDLAARGCHVFRFDFHGAGESTGEHGPLRLDRPFVADLKGATEWLTGQGLENQVLVGSCFGALTALAAADHIPAVRGLILSTPFTRDVERGERMATLMAMEWTPRQYLRRVFTLRIVRGLLARERRKVYLAVARAKFQSVMRRGNSGNIGGKGSMVSRTVLDPLESVVRASIPTLLLFGVDDDAYHEFQQEREGVLGRILDGSGGFIDVETVPGRIHGLRSLASQESLLSHTHAWLQQHGFIQETADV